MKIHFNLRYNSGFGQQLQLIYNLGSDQGSAVVSMNYLNAEFWQFSLDTEAATGFLQYSYQLLNSDGSLVQDWGQDRRLALEPAAEVQIIDSWNYAGEFENAFYTAPFQNILLPAHSRNKKESSKDFTHLFKVKAPLLQKHEIVCLAGDGAALKNWDIQDPIHMHLVDNFWTAALKLPTAAYTVKYKYGVYNTKTEKFIRFESGENRQFEASAFLPVPTVLQDGFVRLPNDSWKGSGVAIPVFSLRSKKSFGVGEFKDLELLADWAKEVHIKLIQLLPVNDTTATGSWTDSYPYAAISAFALHPIYINLKAVAGKKQAALVKALKPIQEGLNALPQLDYEAVLKVKTETLRLIFEAQPEDWQEHKDYQEFLEKNRYWLLPYAAYCYLRDKYSSPDFTSWKQHAVYNQAAIEKFSSPNQKHYKQILFHYFVQYHLHLQLQEATAYAHKKGLIIKGDIPIGIYRFSCDAWMAPELYHMDQQSGAPPDDFAIKGQNWGFPTYNWNRMQEDGYGWWKKRFEQMSAYFDAFRIDHILGFFRIWSIPLDAVEGIMGQFSPAIPVGVEEFRQNHISFNYSRYAQPYITEDILKEKFVDETLSFARTFFEAGEEGRFKFKADFNTQRKIESWFQKQLKDEGYQQLKQGLYDLLANVIVFEATGSEQQAFHFRFGMEATSSFQSLEYPAQHALKYMYTNYFYQRQDELWKKEALQKLPALKASTNMLICGEDLGMVPASVPAVMQQLGILSLELQRMPKDPATEFFSTGRAPYLSVVTPSTHDMSTIRGWWEEEPAKTQSFFNRELGLAGRAPETCEAWINKEIVRQHLESPAMWSIFQLQDLLGMDAEIRLPDFREERINIPAIAKYYWRYRMHLSLEHLIKEKGFNEELKSGIKAAGRN